MRYCLIILSVLFLCIINTSNAAVDEGVQPFENMGWDISYGHSEDVVFELMCDSNDDWTGTDFTFVDTDDANETTEYSQTNGSYLTVTKTTDAGVASHQFYYTIPVNDRDDFRKCTMRINYFIPEVNGIDGYLSAYLVQGWSGTITTMGYLPIASGYHSVFASIGGMALSDLADTCTAVNQGNKTFDFAGTTTDRDVYNEYANKTFYVDSSTGNDGAYTVNAQGAAESGGTVTVPVKEAVPHATGDGTMHIVRTSLTSGLIYIYFRMNSDVGKIIHLDSIQIIANDTMPRIMLSFDNTDITQYTNVRPALNARGIKGTFYVVKGEVFEQSSTATRMTEAQLLQLQKEGHLVANHATPSTNWVSQSLLHHEKIYECMENRRYLKSIGIREGRFFFCMPNGSGEVGATEALRAETYRLLNKLNYSTRMTTGVTVVDGMSVAAIGGFNPLTCVNIKGASRILYSVNPTDYRDARRQVDRALMDNGLAVMHWHYVGDGGTAGAEISTADFTAMLDYAVEQGCEFVTPLDMMPWNPAEPTDRGGYRGRYKDRGGRYGP